VPTQAHAAELLTLDTVQYTKQNNLLTVLFSSTQDALDLEVGPAGYRSTMMDQKSPSALAQQSRGHT
jgi:hypothetical protein